MTKVIHPVVSVARRLGSGGSYPWETRQPIAGPVNPERRGQPAGVMAQLACRAQSFNPKASTRLRVQAFSALLS